MSHLALLLRRAVAATLIAVAAPHAAVAAPFFGEGRCALIVASRPDRPSAEAYVAAHRIGPGARLFASRNDWLAISTGLLGTHEADVTIARLKATGRVPPDAYCSTGEAYVREIAMRPAGPAGRLDEPPAGLLEAFDPRPYSAAERRALQAALSYLDRYHGLLDGEWGPGSQAALEAWSRAEIDAEPINLLAGVLLTVLADAIEREGWRMHHEPALDLSFALPTALLRPQGREGARAWSDPYGALSVSAERLAEPQMRRVHAATLAEAAPGTQPYAVRGADRWVTSILGRDGRTSYRRSERRGAAWSHVAVVGDPAMAGPLSVVLSSIAPGRAEPSLLPAGGEAARQMALAEAFLGEDPQAGAHGGMDGGASASPGGHGDAPRAPRWLEAPPAAAAPPGLVSTGSGFVVNAAGEVVTNHHVIEGCAVVEVDGRAAAVLAAWPEADLAVLAPRPLDGARPHVRLGAGAARLNADVTVAGYPLVHLLGGLNITRGSVTGLNAMWGESGAMQISAPIQAGNSGGPVFDRAGAVVGVVVATLDPRAVDPDLGLIPQNVNFAVKAEWLTSFLAAHGIAFATAEAAGPALPPEDLADRAAAVTVLVTCR